jgi:hypothetical protein
VATERHQEHELAVLEAARDERAARKALEALGARQPGWTEAQEAAHRDQLERWQVAARRLGNALHGLNRASAAEIHVTRL